MPKLEDIKTIAPQFKGKTENFDMEKFKSGRSKKSQHSDQKQTNFTKAQSSKPRLAPITSKPKPTMMGYALASEDGRSQTTTPNASREEPAAKIWFEMTEAEARQPQGINPGTRDEEMVRMMFTPTSQSADQT